MQYEDLNADGFRETPGILLEGSRTNVALQSQTFQTTWVVRAATITADGASANAPDGTATADRLNNTAGNAIHDVRQDNIAATAGSWAGSVYVHANNLSFARIQFFNATDGIFAYMAMNPVTGALITSGGTAFKGYNITALANGWYRISVFGTSTVINSTFYVNLCDAAGNETWNATGNEKLDIWGGQVENAAFPSSYIKTVASAVTRAADSLTLPFNFGPMDMTVLARMARPVHADASGNIGAYLRIFNLGNSVSPYLEGFANRASTRDVTSSITAAVPQEVSTPLPAGATQAYVFQFKDFGTGAKTRVDVGAGFTGFTAAASIIPAFGSQVLRIARGFGGGDELSGVLIDLKARPGLITLAAMQTEPGFSPANPIEVTELDAPGPLISKAQSGRVNLRSTQQIGRSWTERYLLQTTQASHKEFLARMTNYWRNGTIFPKGHVDYALPKGLGTGFVLVKGASQTGSTLVVDGCPLNTVGWLLAGDIFRVQGLPQVFQASADVNSEGDGTARIPLVVPIFTGGSPSDNATLTLTGVTMDVVLLEPPSFPTTSGVGSDYGELVLKLSEAL